MPIECQLILKNQINLENIKRYQLTSINMQSVYLSA
jgi:hypothetical protein